MSRKIINIDEDKCVGCGLCAEACHESAIGIVDGKAKLVREDYCDGLGNCLPVCPTGAISFKETGHVECMSRMTESLSQWPVQIKLVSPNAAFFQGSDLLIAADCTAYAYANFHLEFMQNKITVIGCPKLDNCDYSEKLTDILKGNDFKSVTIVRMQVPCCGGLENAVKIASENCGKSIKYQVVTISTDGKIL